MEGPIISIDVSNGYNQLIFIGSSFFYLFS